MLHPLLTEWSYFDSYQDPENPQVSGVIWHAQRWEYDEATHQVVFSDFDTAPGRNYYDQVLYGGSQDNGPQDYARPRSDRFLTESAPGTVTGYFHDGDGGVETLTLTLRLLTTICFGADTGQLLLSTAGLPGPYTYRWSNGATTADPGLVAAGRHEVTVTHEPTGAACSVALTAEQNARLNVLIEKTDTQVTLQASGGTAPYTYRWEDGSTLATRTDLVRGVHACTITDALGCQTEAVVDFSRLSYYFSRNPIPLRLDAGPAYRDDPTTLPNLTFTCQVLVEQQYLSDEFTAVGTELEQPADREGRTAFQVQELLAPYLDYHVPPASGPVAERATALFKRFFLRHAQVSGTPPTKGASTGAEQFYVVLGGLSFHEAQARTWFTSYQPTVQPFLTWEPNDKWVLDDQPEFLYFQALAPAAVAEVVVAIDLADSAQRVVVLAELTQLLRYEIYCLGVGFGQGLAAGLTAEERGQVLGWQVWVRDADGVALSEERRYYLERQRPAQVRYLLYGNSLGGMNTFVATGQAQQDAEVTGDQVELSLPLDYDPLRGDTAVLERELRPVLKLASGVGLGRAEHLALQELLLSRRVLLRNQGRWLAGYVKTKSVNIVDEGKPVPTLDVDFVLPTERQFTPYLPAAATVAVGPDSGAL